VFEIITYSALVCKMLMQAINNCNNAWHFRDHIHRRIRASWLGGCRGPSHYFSGKAQNYLDRSQ